MTRIMRRALGTSEDMALAIALLPSLALGILFFSLNAALRLLLGLVIGALAGVIWSAVSSRSDRELVHRMSPLVSPALMALAAVMLLPADLPLLAVCGVALSASLFAVISAPFSGWVRISPALAGFAVAVATASGHFRTLPVPFSPQVNAPDPLLQIGQPLDPTQLYVGDAPSLMASGSVLAVAVGILTLYTWHRLLRQRRGGIVLWPLAGFLIADTAVAAVARIDLGSQILQGPALFAAGLLAGDSRLMDDHPAAGLAAGMAGGALAAVLRAAGAGVAAAPLAMTLGMLVATPIQHVRLNLGDRRARTTRSLLPRPRPPQSAEDAAAQAEPPAEGA